MELADYLRVLRRRWWLILLITLICSGGSAATTFSKAPTYTATTRLLVVPRGGSDVARVQANTRATVFAQYLGTGQAASAVRQQAKAVGVYATTTAVADGTSPFIIITVVASSAKAAEQIANSYKEVLPDVISQLEQSPASEAPTISTVEPATVPASPSSPNHQRDILVGIALGLVLGIAGALIRETLDARVRESSEIERLTGSTLLGSVPKESSSDVLVSATRPRSGRAEAYRHIRTNLEFTGPGGMPRSIVITSPAPSEGKSSLSANLAIVAARSGRRVALVDADLRKPSIAKYFGVRPGIGLSEVLTGQHTWQQAMIQIEGEQIHLLSSGALPKFPSELVGSSRMAQLIQELEQTYDLVVIDTPPVLPVSDALIMGVNVGGVVMVARMKESRRAAVKRAVDAVNKVDANLLGVVANAAVRREEKAYGAGYGYAYGYNNKAKSDDRGDIMPPSMEPATRRSAGRRAAAGKSPIPIQEGRTPTSGRRALARDEISPPATTNGLPRGDAYPIPMPAVANGQPVANGQRTVNGERTADVEPAANGTSMGSGHQGVNAYLATGGHGAANGQGEAHGYSEANGYAPANDEPHSTWATMPTPPRGQPYPAPPPAHIDLTQAPPNQPQLTQPQRSLRRVGSIPQVPRPTPGPEHFDDIFQPRRPGA